MKIFSGSANKPLAEKIVEQLGIDLSPVEHHVFPDGEQRIKLMDSVLEEDCVVVQPTGVPTDKNYMELFFIIDALKRSGAREVTVVIPYVGYQRQDHVFREGESRSLEVVIRFMEEAGADKFVVADLHSIKIAEIFKKPVAEVSGLPIFAQVIKQNGFLTDDTVLGSPDMGGLRRLHAISSMLDDMHQIAVEKNRDLTTGEIDAKVVHGQVKRRVLLVDDMISSGKTIVQACDVLTAKGAEEIFVFATHAVFSENASEILQKSKAQKIFVTDSLFVPKDKWFPKLEVLSLAEDIGAKLKNTNT